MLRIDEAKSKLQKQFPTAVIQNWVGYRDVYLFRVRWDSPNEEDYDPFVSVHSQTGEVREFSVLADGDLSEIALAFAGKQG